MTHTDLRPGLDAYRVPICWVVKDVNRRLEVVQRLPLGAAALSLVAGLLGAFMGLVVCCLWGVDSGTNVAPAAHGPRATVSHSEPTRASAIARGKSSSTGRESNVTDSSGPAPARRARIEGAPASDGVCGTRDDGTDDRGNPLPSEEWYDFGKINDKLAAYPELRRATGLSRVRTCNDARAFIRGYNAYVAEHPTFQEGARAKQ